MLRAISLLALGVAAITLGTPSSAQADKCDDFDANCHVDNRGAELLVATQLHQLGRDQQVAQKTKKPYWIYATRLACGADGLLYSSGGCSTAELSTWRCPAGEGPLVEIFRRQMTSDGKPDPDQTGTFTINGIPGWEYFGRTCVGDEVPGAARLPSIAMIREAFHKTPWATASLGFQPAKNRTLVNLTNYYAAHWSTQGFGPGEVDAVDPALMFGHRVDIRPKLVGFVYHYGDGKQSERTTSTGGTYPDGDIRHVYTRTGVFQAHLTVTWSADFRIDGGAWLDIDDTVSVDQLGRRRARERRTVMVVAGWSTVTVSSMSSQAPPSIRKSALQVTVRCAW